MLTFLSSESLKMSSNNLDLSFLIPPLSLSPLLCMITIISFFIFFSNGGLAWFFSKSNIPGPTGMFMAFSSPTAHQALSKLAHSLKALNLMAISVGFTRFIISSHPETAKDILNSSAFADRPIKESAYELLFNRAIGFAPFGEYWRNLRRISATYLFSLRRIQSFAESRQVIGLQMVDEIKSAMEKDGAVGVKQVFHFGSLNSVMMSVFGKKFEFGTGEGLELKDLVSEGYELLGVFNWSDHLPVLGWFDFQGVRKRCRELVKKVNVFVGKIIEEHRVKRMNGAGSSGDFVDVLLDLEKDEKLSDSDMVAVLWEMIFRGTDTVAITLEWVMARMVLHPEIQSKIQSEIDAVTSKSRPVSDSDIPSLTYLQAVVKECLRLHTPGPLLTWPRLAIHDVQINDHFIPAGTTAMVNMWSITHDESVWANPKEFDPDRFVREDVSILGSDLRLAPFGSGRRVCPGKAMGLAMVHLWLAQMLQSFDWVAAKGNGVELEECLTMSMEMKTPLVCKAVARV